MQVVKGLLINHGCGAELVVDTVDAEKGGKRNHNAERDGAKDQAQENRSLYLLLFHHLSRVRSKMLTNSDHSGVLVHYSNVRASIILP